MNYLTKIISGISAIISVIILILFLLSLVALISNGGGNVLFPGLGLIVSMWLIVVVLFVMMVISVSFTMLLYKLVYKRDLAQ